MMICKIIYILGTTIFTCGIFVMFYDYFELEVRKIKRKTSLKKSEDNKYQKNIIIRYTDEMLNIVFPSGRVDSIKLIIISIVIFTVTFLLFYPVMKAKSFLPALFFFIIPFILIRFKLEKTRNKGSKEAEKLVSGLLNSYRMNHRNILAAIEGFIKEEVKDCELTSRLLYRFLVEVRSTRNKEIIKQASDKFAFGIKTNWSYMLSHCIFAAVYEGIDVSESLEDILEQLKTARVLEEEKKRANSESIRLIKFLVPIAYAASLCISVFMMDIPLNKIISNQFSDITGAGIFFIITALFIINTLLLDIIKNGRFDY